MKIVKFSRKCSDREQQSVEDQDPTYQGRKLSISSRKCFSIFAKKRNTSSTSCRSTDLESLDEETGSGSEGWVRHNLKQNNSRTPSLSSKWRIFQQQSTSSCDSGVFQDSVKTFRVLLLGAPGVGKTSLISQLLKKRFSAQYKPTLQEMYSVEMDLGGSPCVLNIEDTGQNFAHEFPAMADVSLRAADGVVLVFSVADPSSFEEVS